MKHSEVTEFGEKLVANPDMAPDWMLSAIADRERAATLVSYILLAHKKGEDVTNMCRLFAENGKETTPVEACLAANTICAIHNFYKDIPEMRATVCEFFHLEPDDEKPEWET